MGRPDVCSRTELTPLVTGLPYASSTSQSDIQTPQVSSIDPSIPQVTVIQQPSGSLAGSPSSLPHHQRIARPSQIVPAPSPPKRHCCSDTLARFHLPYHSRKFPAPRPAACTRTCSSQGLPGRANKTRRERTEVHGRGQPRRAWSGRLRTARRCTTRRGGWFRR